jgi:hypothetical protein
MSICLSLITDEVSPVLADGLRMAAEEGLGKVDIRSIGGVNFMSLDEAAQRSAANEIRDAGLAVGTLATPLLKWPAPGHAAADMGDQFGFDTKGRTTDQLYEDAFRCADILGARNLRVFSLLKHDGFTLAELDDDYARLIRLAEKHDVTIQPAHRRGSRRRHAPLAEPAAASPPRHPQRLATPAAERGRH